jgi:hypothetical protein
VTVGDTTLAGFVIRNDGNIPLQLTSIDLPSTVMRHTLTLPLDLSPGGQMIAMIHLEPRLATNITGDVLIHCNDPLTSVVHLPVSTDIRWLDFATKLLSQAAAIPLGEAVTVEVTPAQDVHIEWGYLYHRPAGTVAFSDSIPLTVSVDEFIAVIPGEAVTEAGLEYYVKVENSGITAYDPVNAPSGSVYFQAVEAPVSITTSPTPNRGSEFLAGLDIKVQVTLPEGTSFDHGTLHYRTGGKAEYHAVDIQAGDPLPFAVIPDSIPGPRGVEYWAEIQTLTRNLTDPPGTPELNPHGIRVTVTNLSEEQTHPAELYRLLSIPLDLRGPMTGVLTDDLGGPDPVRWRMFTYLTDRQAYSEVPNDSIFSFEHGRGYWMITKEPHQLDTGPAEGLSTSTDSAFALALKPGYNLVGNPFDFPVAWDSILVDTLAGGLLTMAEAETIVVEPPVVWTGSTGYQFDAEILDPFNGCWVKNISDSLVFLRIPPREALPETSQAAIRMAAGLAGPDEAAGTWRLRITASCSGKVDASSSFGVAHGADDEWDRHDRSEPPLSPAPSLAIYFPHADWEQHPGNYAIDIRGAYRALQTSASGLATSGDGLLGHLWRFDVLKNFTAEGVGDEVALTFQGMQAIPRDASVFLLDQYLDQLVDLRESGSYQFFCSERDFVLREDEARFLILVGSRGFIEAWTEDLVNVPARTALYQNRPNPFNPATVIRYELAQPGPVVIRIYNLGGALVRTLVDEHHEAGSYEVAWRGKDARGQQVSSGVYFYRLTAGPYTETRRMLLLK